MKKYNIFLCLFLALAFLIGTAPCASAQGAVEAVSDGNGRFEGKSWEEVVEKFLSDRGTDPRYVGIGYLNTVTGEEHYINADQYMVAGSLYKVPLNMYFTEKIAKGEMNWDSLVAGTEYKKLLEITIVESNNTYAEYMWNNMGGYHQYRRLICPYMGEDADTVDYKFYENNFFTPRQMVHCLKLLYTESSRFPGVIDTMLRAEPENYFNYKPQQFDVAHKYGFNAEGWRLFLNDCAIVYTDDPIVLVMFTDAITEPYDALADFCTLMCDYTQYHTALRLEQEAQEALKAQQEAEKESVDEKNDIPIPPVTDSTESKNGGSTIKTTLISAALVILIAVLTVCAVIKMARYAGEGRVKGLWGILSVLLTAAALLLCVLGATTGTLIARPSGDPQETVLLFFDSIVNENYEAAYGCLDDYSSLGLENSAQSELGELVHDALRTSYSYTLRGNCAVSGLKAKQQVLLRYLDLNAVSADLKELTNKHLEAVVEDLPRDRVYDENDNYLPAVTDEAYSRAVKDVLSRAGEYYNTATIDLELNYHDGQWLITTNPALLSALLGGTA